MEKIIIRLLIITSWCSFSAKHVFIQDPHSWTKAREYCREHHTDLSPITNDLEEMVLRESVGQGKSGWIGLHCYAHHHTWRWSGGSYSTNKYRAPTLLIAINWTTFGWFPAFYWKQKSFFCLNLIVVQEEKTWEEALDHCRGTHTDLTSLLSKTENILAQTKIQHSNTTERVWIGLRYLGDSWMWVNGDRLEYKAQIGAGNQENLNPTKQSCGALTKSGVWEMRDCQERLNFICV